MLTTAATNHPTRHSSASVVHPLAPATDADGDAKVVEHAGECLAAKPGALVGVDHVRSAVALDRGGLCILREYQSMSATRYKTLWAIGRYVTSTHHAASCLLDNRG